MNNRNLNRYKFVLLAALIGAVFILLPSVPSSQAQTTPTLFGSTGDGKAAVTEMVDRIVDGLAWILFPLATLIIAGAGFFFIISRGNPVAFKVVAAVIVGIFIFLIARMIPAAVVGIFT